MRYVFLLLFLHDLNEELPAWIVVAFDAFEQVALVTLTIAADQFSRFGVGQVLDALQRFESERHPEAFILGIDEAVGVAAETMHITKRFRNAAIAHHDGDLMQGFGQA
jgi:hypothetical protein